MKNGFHNVHLMPLLYGYRVDEVMYNSKSYVHTNLTLFQSSYIIRGVSRILKSGIVLDG